ncbi:MAG TPA: nucleotide exchange factor GrpE [Rhabdochlamydiaceae bacterium]|nr:nucleotide exchange factor GrpE [Rhabdochlamydiaceae bacterium]
MTEEEKIEETTTTTASPTLEQQLEEYKDKYFRLLAESENMRKRMQKERHELTRFSIEQAFADLLTPLDNMENALHYAEKMSDEVRNWAVGFEMILSQFRDVLHSHGIAAFPSHGEQFDPLKHEAVEMEETADHCEGKILHEFTKGYKSKERTIRPARVKVAKSPSADEAKNLESKEN